MEGFTFSTRVRVRFHDTDAQGKLLEDNVFYSSYRASPKLVRVGPKPKKAKPAATKPQPKTRP